MPADCLAKRGRNERQEQFEKAFTQTSAQSVCADLMFSRLLLMAVKWEVI